MKEKNSIAFEKFDDYLRLRQKEGVGDAAFDIRDWMVSQRYADWNVGYNSANLEKKYGANLRSLFPHAVGFDEKGFGSGEHYFFLGTVYKDHSKSHKGMVNALNAFEIGDHFIFAEQGFLATSHSWSESFKAEDPKFACLGYVYDDISHYFMADYPNRLIHRLNSDHIPCEQDLIRAKSAMVRIVEEKVSKYNSQPIVTPSMSEGYDRRVMVCDQAFADASTVYGKLHEYDFEQMLLTAIRENPDAQILVKTHPDTHWEKGKRVGYYNHLEDVGRIRILREPVNPYCLFDCVDTVYVGSSQMGLEALLAGNKVVCFGAPFYAGWGLTDDRQAVPHRHRTRSLEEIFYYFYIWYTIYHVPECAVPSRIEDALDYIVKHRPVSLPVITPVVSDRPKVSVILPVYGVEKYINQCLQSIRDQSLQDIEIITINDCSPDGSQSIIDRHAAEDQRLRPILLKQNIGQGFARNVGIEAARGEYIQFIDSDDYLATQDYLECIYTAAIHDDAQMVRGRKIFERLENAKGQKIGLRRDWCESYFEEPFHRKTLVEKKDMIHGRHFWNWLYKRDYLLQNDIRFLTSQWEEKPFLLKALLRATCISSIDHEGFVYRVRVDSTARRKKELKDTECQLLNFESLIELLLNEGAFDRESDLFDISRFIVTQFLSIVLTGFVRETILRELGISGELALFERLNHLVQKTGMRASDVSDLPHNLRADLKAKNAYPLIFAGLLSRKYQYVRTALSLTPIQQNEYIAEMLMVPSSESDRQLQEALSLFARNGLVASDQSVAEVADKLQSKPRLVIHIGSTKTGSTFIQHFLEQNRAALLRAGVYVPEVGLFWQKERPHKQAGHAHFVPQAVKGETALKEHVEAVLVLAEGRIHTVILSSEAYFLNPKAIELARQFAEYEVEMVTYLRRQDDWANSQYAEFVAGGAVGRVSQPIDEWLKTDETRSRLDYLGRIKLWETVIDKSRIHIGIYDRKQLKDGDIVSDFLTLVGLDEFADLPRPQAGQENGFPFGTAHVKLISRLNKEPWSDRTKYFNFIEEAGQKITEIRGRRGEAKPTLSLLSREQRLAILDSVAATNATLAREYLGRADGILFESKEFSVPQGEDSIRTSEFDAIMESYEKWRPRVAKASNNKPVSKASNGKSIAKAQNYQKMIAYKCAIWGLSILGKKGKKKRFLKDPLIFLKKTDSFVGNVFQAIFNFEYATRFK